MSIKKVSRSAIDARRQCEMKRYRQYEFRQTGMVPQEFAADKNGIITMGALPTVRGQLFHTAALDLIQGKQDWVERLNQGVQVMPEVLRGLQSTLIRRAMLGWDQVRGPWWRQHFDVVASEQEWLWPLTQTIMEPMRLDNVLRRKDDGALGIMDYKTLSSVDPNWNIRMEASTQTHLYVQALKEKSREPVIGICYDGVVIGQWKNGKQRSPFVLGFKKFGKITTKWSQGSEDVDLTQWPDDEWLGWLGPQLKELYCATGFLHPPSVLLLHTKHSAGRAEEEWAHRVELVESHRRLYGEDSMEYAQALHLIEKNDSQCYKYGVDYACPFVRQCWQGFEWDGFVERKDHHGEESKDAQEG